MTILKEELKRDFSILSGLELKSCTISIGTYKQSDEITFITKDDRTFKMYHPQKCCEEINIVQDYDDGDLENLQDCRILWTRMCDNFDDNDMLQGSQFWAFYNIQTNKGHVQFRWCGQDNFYSVEVAFVEMIYV